jgi:hypothetical protein
MINLRAKEMFTRPFFVGKVMGDFDTELAETWSKKRARGTFLHLDNVPMHRADDDFNRLGIKRLIHPSYSQSLISCDFSLFETLKNKFEGNTFANEIEVKSKVYEILINIPLHEFISVFNECMHRIRECIDSGDEYF